MPCRRFVTLFATAVAIWLSWSEFSPAAAHDQERTNPAAKDEDTGHTTDSLATVKKNLADKKAVLVDVREQREWERGHLKGATLIPLSGLRKTAGNAAAAKRLTKELPRKKIIYCHCGSGVRVLTAAPLLRKLGFTVRPLEAGYEDLVKAGFPKAAAK